MLKQIFHKYVFEIHWTKLSKVPILRWSILQFFLKFLATDGEVQRVFQPPPIVSYRSARKIKDYTVRSKLYPVERNLECQGCGNFMCPVCKSINITDKFSSLTTKKTHKINHSFDCNDKCLIYQLRCKSCSKQYAGITNHFRTRWNNYKSNESGNVKQKPLQSNFLQRDHQGSVDR